MFRWRKCLCVMMLLAGLVNSANRAHAQGQDDLFTVGDIGVDVTAENAVLARGEAVNQAKILGLERMMRKLTAESDWGLLPRVDAEAIDNFVIGFGVEQEEILPTRYVAELSVTYRPDAVRRLMRGSGATYVEQRSPTLLILPLMVTSDGSALFEPENSWMAAWREGIDRNQLVKMTLPNFGHSPEQLSADQALQGDVAAIQAFARTYGIGDVLVAQATLDLNATYPEAVRIRGRYLTPDGSLADVVVDVIRNNGRELPEVLYRKAINRIEATLVDNWKSLALERYGRRETMVTRVLLDRLDEWMVIRGILESSDLVGGTKLQQFGKGFAMIEIDYFGGLSEFLADMRSSGLEFVKSGGEWQVSMDDILPAQPLAPLAPATNNQ